MVEVHVFGQTSCVIYLLFYLAYLCYRWRIVVSVSLGGGGGGGTLNGLCMPAVIPYDVVALCSQCDG